MAADLEWVLAGLREQKAVVRFSQEFIMYFKPHPKLYPPELIAGLKEHAVRLAGLLVPCEFLDYSVRRFWEHADSLSGCYACGQSCRMIDPLGNPRHLWCGWTDQVGLQPPGKAPGYPKKVDAGPLPQKPVDYPVGKCSCGRTSIRLYEDGKCFWCRRGSLA